MNRYAWPVTIIIVAVIIAAGSIAVALVLHRGSDSAPAPSGSATAPPSAGAVGSPSPTTAQTPAVPLTDFTVCTLPVASCAGEMRTEPATVLVSGDGSGYVKVLRWSGWGSATAQGTGTLEIDNCSPNCAQGSDTGYPATVVLSDLTPYGSGKQAYADMVISAPTAPNGSYSYKNLVP